MKNLFYELAQHNVSDVLITGYMDSESCPKFHPMVMPLIG